MTLKLKLSTALQLVVAVTLMFTIAGFFLSDDRRLMNIESLLYLTVISVVVMVMSAQASSVVYPLVVLLCLYAYKKYLLSGLYLLTSRSSAISDDLSLFTEYHYNRYLLYAVFGVVVSWLGLAVGSGSFKSRPGINRPTLPEGLVALISPIRVLIYVTLIVVIQLYLMFVLGVANEALNDDPRNFWRIFLRQTVPRELLILMLFFMWNRYSLLQKITAATGLLVLLFGSMIVGSSRAGLELLVLLYIVLKIAKDGDFALTFGQIKYLAYAIVISVALFPLVTSIRWAGYDREFYASRDFAAISDQTSTFTSSSDVLVLIMERFTGLRQALPIMNDMYLNDPSDLLSFGSMLKRVANSLVPGDIFDVMAPQYLYDHIYRNRFIGFNAEEWGIWEYFYVAYGYGLGLVVVFAYMLTIGWLWRRLCASQSTLQPFTLLVSGYFFSLFLVNYDPGYVIQSFLIELIVMLSLVPLLRTMARGPLAMSAAPAFRR
jgi:hypothetical protein